MNKLIITVFAVAVILTACGTKTTDAPVESTTISEQKTSEDALIPESEYINDIPSSEESEDLEEKVVEESEEWVETSEISEESFEITTEEINAFIIKIQQAVASKDLEAMADLCGYPVYVSLGEGQGNEINSRQDFLNLGSENIFTNNLTETIAEIDPKTLEVFGAGVILGENANIIFNKVEGILIITGINL